MDLFATPYNAKLPSFVSPFPHPRAWGVDALTIEWNVWEEIYLFPPHSLLKEVLLKLQDYENLAVVIARPPSTDPLTVELARRARKMWPLRHVPRQLVRGEWVFDCGTKSWKWTVYMLCKKH